MNDVSKIKPITKKYKLKFISSFFIQINIPIRNIKNVKVIDVDSNICHLNIGEIATSQGKAIYFLPNDKFAKLKILKIKVETTAVKNN